MVSFVAKLYQNVFRRTSSFVLAAVAGTFMFERGFDLITDGLYDNVNQGKMWKHIKNRYGQQALDEGEEE